MKAITYTRYGPPEVLTLTDVPKPKPRGDELLVKIKATTVSIEDPKMRNFTRSVSHSLLLWLIVMLKSDTKKGM